jgi:hypothetical protein
MGKVLSKIRISPNTPHVSTTRALDLYYSVQNRDPELLSHYISYHLSLDESLNFNTPEFISDHFTLLSFAILQRSLPCVKIIVETNHFDLDAPFPIVFTSYGQFVSLFPSYFHAAIGFGSVEIAQYLVEKGATVGSLEWDSNNPRSDILNSIISLKPDEICLDLGEYERLIEYVFSLRPNGVDLQHYFLDNVTSKNSTLLQSLESSQNVMCIFYMHKYAQKNGCSGFPKQDSLPDSSLLMLKYCDNFEFLKTICDLYSIPLDTTHPGSKQLQSDIFDRYSFVCEAISHNQINGAKFFLSLGAKPTYLGNNGAIKRMILLAIRNFITPIDLDWALNLLAIKTSFNQIFPHKDSDNVESAPFDIAVASGQVEMANYLFENDFVLSDSIPSLLATILTSSSLVANPVIWLKSDHDMIPIMEWLEDVFQLPFFHPNVLKSILSVVLASGHNPLIKWLLQYQLELPKLDPLPKYVDWTPLMYVTRGLSSFTIRISLEKEIYYIWDHNSSIILESLIEFFIDRMDPAIRIQCEEKEHKNRLKWVKLDETIQNLYDSEDKPDEIPLETIPNTDAIEPTSYISHPKKKPKVKKSGKSNQEQGKCCEIM